MNPTYYNAYKYFFISNDLDIWIVVVTLGILAFIGACALCYLYLHWTFGILIKAYYGTEDIMIRLNAAFFCCECDTIFDWQEAKGECPACGNRYCVSVNQIIKQKNAQPSAQPLFAFPIMDYKASCAPRLGL